MIIIIIKSRDKIPRRSGSLRPLEPERAARRRSPSKSA